MQSSSDQTVFPTSEELAVALPQYNIGERIQVGRESAVYLAHQTALDRPVKVRVLAEPDSASAQRLMERLKARARMVHPRLVAVYDFGRTQAGNLFLVTESVVGHLVADLVHERQITPKIAYGLALELCEALAMIHAEGKIHGCLTTNVLIVDVAGHLKVSGMGMKKLPDGELSWMQEEAGSQQEDILALGHVLHELFGKEPLPEDGRVSRNLPPAFAAVIRRCLQTDSSQGRLFESALEVKEALTAALKSQQSAAKKAEPGAQDGTTSPADNLIAKSPASPAPTDPAMELGRTTGAAPMGAIPPPRYAPGRPPAPVVRPRPSFLSRLDDFLWSCLRAGLHLSVFLVTIGILFVFHLMKDKIVLQDADDVGSERAEPALPAAMLGDLPPAEPPLPVASPVSNQKSITLPAITAPVTPSPEVLALDAEYLSAVQTATAAALDQVRLAEIPHLQKELSRIQQGTPMPKEDEPGLPASLKLLRENYRQRRAALGQ